MSLDGAYDPDNVFARVIRGELPAHKVWESGEVLAFMDLFPQSRGHVLVVSKAGQARNLLDVEPEHLQAVMLGVQRVARAVRTALEPNGVIVTQFNGAHAGQSVFHLHVHIIPTYEGSWVSGHRWEAVTRSAEGAPRMADAGELAELARRIAAEIR